MLGRREVGSLELLRGLPGHRAQLLVPIADPQLRIVAGAKSEQFIDHELSLAALHLNPLYWTCEYVGLHLVVDPVADSDPAPQHLVNAFNPAAQLHPTPPT